MKDRLLRLTTIFFPLHYNYCTLRQRPLSRAIGYSFLFCILHAISIGLLSLSLVSKCIVTLLYYINLVTKTISLLNVCLAPIYCRSALIFGSHSGDPLQLEDFKFETSKIFLVKKGVFPIHSDCGIFRIFGDNLAGVHDDELLQEQVDMVLFAFDSI